MHMSVGMWVVGSASLLPLVVLLLSPPPVVRGQDAGEVGGARLRFTADQYEASVFENSPARTYLASVSRMGVPLLRRSWEPRFRVAGGDGEGLFRAEELRLGDFCFLRLRLRGGGAAILNREVASGYELRVRASLRGQDGQEAWTRVIVRVLDRNDLRPLFSPTTYSARISEDTPPRASVAQVTATDADSGSNGEFYYFLKHRSDLFAVHPASGVLTLTAALPSLPREHQLEVGAVDRGMKLYGNNGVSSTARVMLHLETRNQHSPRITTATIQPTRAGPQQLVAVVTVTDEDRGANGEIADVQLVGGDSEPRLRLERRGEGQDGEVELVLLTEEGFDWALPGSLSVTLQAHDRGNPPRYSPPHTLTLRSPPPDPPPPSFPDGGYHVHVSELAPPGTLLVAVALTPPPPDALYTLSDAQTHTAAFVIGPRSGVISTATWLTGLEEDTLTLQVTEETSGLKVKVHLTLMDENDNTPVFSRRTYHAVVNESVPIGTTVLLLTATDADRGENGYITYSLEEESELAADWPPFSINQFSGAVLTSGRLDFERQAEFWLTARASDWGWPERRESRASVHVSVHNQNDERPLWGGRGCQLVVPPLWPIDTPLLTLAALDPDRLTPIKYSIQSGDPMGLFTLQPDTGLLLLTRPLPTGHIYSLHITATDGDHASDPMGLNITTATSVSAPSLSCQDTQVAKQLAEKLSRPWGRGRGYTQGEGLLDLFSANRHAPRFSEEVPDKVWVPEDTPIGTRLLQLQVTDDDAGLSGQLLYSIAHGNSDDCLTVGMRSGEVTVFQRLDRERTDRYHANISVYDQGSPQRSTWKIITFIVTDVNDNTPLFLVPNGYHTHIPENTPIGTQVVELEAVDADEGSNAVVLYSLLTEAPFGINASSGLVYVAGQLDRETTPSYMLRVEARDSAPERAAQRVAVTTLEVTLEDVNDVAPVLIPSRVCVRVREDTPVGALIAWPDTHDPDLGPGGVLTHTLANDYAATFTIDTHTGAIRLNKELDYETQQVYNVTVRVRDGGVPVSLLTEGWLEVEVLDVDENRFAPEFSSFATNGSVPEGSAAGTSVMRVEARDDDTGRDGQLIYSLREGSGLGRFTIDEDTGVIYTMDVLDRETQDSYWLTVYATDVGVVPQSAVLHVYIQVEDVNDNAPLTSDPMYRTSVLENSPKDLSIIQIYAQDPDATPTSAHLSFRITSGNARNLFSIDPHTGLITTTSKKLDREQQAEHMLEVTVSDGAPSPQQAVVCVCVSVLDVNDNAPVFLEKVYHVRVPERRRRLATIYRIFAHDRDHGINAQLTYSITDGNADGKFAIDPKTGVVSSRKHSTAGNYDILTIKAVDGGRPQRWASARLHIEWVGRPTDSAPLEFDERLYNFTVTETDRVGEVVGVVSVKHSSTPLWFEITGSSSSSLLEVFSILQLSCGRNCTSQDGDAKHVFESNRATGTIIITQPLDAEQATFYNLTVEATDGTHTIHTQVYITVLDSNDNPPVFSQSVYDVMVTEDTPPETELLRVTATDRDKHHSLTFALQGSVDPTSVRLFRIDPSTGAIHTTHTLDHESNTQHILSVMVKEEEFPYRKALTRVLIGVEDINDHAPTFTMAMYDGQVFESAAIGTAVLTVTALDKDKGVNAQILYTIESGSTGGAFDIDPVQGVVRVARQLDLSAIGHYVLSIRAMDGGTPPLFSTATVHVAVVLSDNAPPRFPLSQYHAQVSENVAIGTSVATVMALSRSTLTYHLRHGNGGGAFSINQYSGVIVTRRAIDYEANQNFSLAVAAGDMAGHEAVVKVMVTVLDSNDNSPEFLETRYHGSVSEGASPGSLVTNLVGGGALLLRAHDADSEQNGQLAYHIADEFARPYFTVDTATGALQTTAALDYETTPTFHFQVSVRDRGRPWRWGGVAMVTVEILDENDTPPRFTQPTYSALLLLPTYQGVELFTVSAHDADTNQSQLRFSLTDSWSPRLVLGAESGILSVRNASGWEAGLERVPIRVTDGRFSGSALVTVTVRMSQEADLRFSKAEFHASVPENRAEPQLVTVVTAVGAKLNEPLRFSLLNGGGAFQIGPTSGAIETVGVALDREEREEHRLVVQVGRHGDPLRVARATVHVSVTDENDNMPLFVGLPYYAAVQVDAAAGTVVCVVRAVDLDAGPNGQVSYFLTDETRPAYFQMDTESGQLKLSRAFEPDLSNAEYQVVVFARDQGQPALSSSVTFTVTVVNRAMPVFDKAFYTVRVNEDVPVFTPVLGINASCPEGQAVLYTLSHTHTSALTQGGLEAPPSFWVGFDTGVISVAVPLDHETAPSHRLVVRATAAVTGARSEVEVEVVVGDVNDNPPTFTSHTLFAVISENAMIGTPVIQVQAVDPDSEKNGVVRYQLLPEGGAVGWDWFHLDSVSGLLLTARRLDRETTPHVTLHIRAHDQGFPPRDATATVTVEIADVNDNAPQFGQLLYEARVSEGAEPGQTVTRVWASDADGQATPLRYSLLSGDEHGLFKLHPLSGVLTVGEAWPGSRRHDDVLVLEVGVSDGVMTGGAQVHVGVDRLNRHTPSFTQRTYEGQVSENAPPGSKVTVVRALDADPGLLGQVRYWLLTEMVQQWVSVDAVAGLVTTVTRLDREQLGNELTFTVAAEDGGGRHGYCNVRLAILDENDNAPQFCANEYRVSVRANTPDASLLTQVLATDADQGSNGRLAYSLYSEASQPITALLDIDVDSGWLVTRAGAGLEAFEGGVLSFFVKAEDGGTPARHALTPVYVHVLPSHAPQLSFSQPQFSFTVTEDTPIGATVGVVKLQAAPPGVVLSVVTGQTEESNHDSVFVIDSLSGALKLDQALDRERVPAFRFRVSASLAQVPVAVVTGVEVEVRVLDINDHAPMFQAASYHTSLPEDTSPGTPVIQVQAEDPDWAANGQVIYSLTPPNQVPAGVRALFVIDKSSGWISTLGGLDHELSPTHLLTVWAWDLGEPVSLSSSTTVTVAVSDINDNPPVFLQTRYHGSVRESDPPGEVVTVINTRDDDSSPSNRQVTYHITGGDSAGVFGLGLVQNEWKLYVRNSLDREQRDHYIINITATDGLHASTVSVDVTVTDANDNSPVCEQALYSLSVLEDVSVGSVLLRVKAADADADANAQIRYTLSGEGAHNFSLHTHTGDLKTAVELDRETTPHYKLVAVATDGGGLSCSADVSITLLDVNDHAPQFGQSELTASVYENTPTKALITRIQAMDPDLGAGGRVVYSLLDSEGVFALDAESGVLSLERALDREHRAAWRVCVLASDQGDPALSAQANLTVNVLDVNDNPPVFERRDYLTALPEDVAVGTEVLRVYAASKDIGTNADIYYSIRHGNQLGHFSIHINTGAISVWRPLDFETCSGYFLTVEARDGGTPPLSAVTMVNINVTDVNDNAPVFSRDVYTATIREDAATGDSVLKVTAEDVDSPANGAVLYSIADGDREKQFFIEPITGLIRVNKPLDRETVMTYSMSVCAKDSGSPPLSSTAVVNIEISDINDNPPTFSSANHTAVIQENTPAGTSILQLSVTDKDSAHNGPPFLFHILSGNEGAEFHLDKEGLLTSNKVFKREINIEYILQVQVWDSGRPSLSSRATVVVRVIEESVHPPSALPLQVHIVAMEDEFPGGVIGQIHASDMDAFDKLTFGHTHQQNSLFKVSPQDGRVIALSGLDGGVYSLNVTVSDGRFSVSVPVSVHVEQASADMLMHGVTLRFDRVAPPTFLQRLPELRLRISAAMATARPELLHVLSLQPVETGQLDLLIAVETPEGGFYKAAYVSQKLAGARRSLDQVLRVSAVLDKNCSALDCRESACEQRLELDSHSMQTHSTHTLSYVTPRFIRHTRCICTDGNCGDEEGVCAGVCPADMQCVGAFGSSGPYTCQCPPGKLGECAGHSSLSFLGNSFIKYSVSDGRRGGAMRISLRIRTLQSRGVIMYTNTHACTQLKLDQGELWFQVDCGSGLPHLGISGRPINDGRWHHVTVELSTNHSSLSLDDTYVEQRRGLLRSLPPAPDWSLVFGAAPEGGVAQGLQERRDRPRRPGLVVGGAGSVSGGFQGCLDALQLNGRELPLQDKRSADARVLTHSSLTLGCTLHPDACQTHPCRNAGTCTSQPAGGFWCSCGAFFTGLRCEVELSVCVPNPCKNAGQCKAIGNAFLCSCKKGYTGLTCEEDVNECEGEECENGGVCINTFGSFFCNCTPGFVGRLCRLRPVLVPDMQAGHAYLGREELIGMATVLFLIVVLVLLFVALRKRLFRKSPSRLALDPAAAALLHKANGAFPPPTHTLPHTHTHSHTHTHPVGIFPESVGPPQVPVRPMAYTPCFQGNDGTRGVGGALEKGAELTEMTTFHPSESSPRILGGVTARRGVVVCSVAPNLPPTSPCRSDCDSLHKSPWESDEGKGEDGTCFGGSNKGSNSEVQSLSSFQSDSCDDNASIVTVIRLVNDAVDTIENEVSVMDQNQTYNRVYHWDTSDWMPSSRLPDIEEVSAYESADTSVTMTMSVGADLESDYYLGGAYDIDSETPPPQGEEFHLSPPVSSEHYDSSPASQPVSTDTTLSRGQKARPQFHPSQYLPPHQLPLTDGPSTGEEPCTFVGGALGKLDIEDQTSVRLSINASSASDVSVPCTYGDSETDSLEEIQQQTEV